MRLVSIRPSNLNPKKSDEYFFPYYEWVTNGSTRAESTALLPQSESTQVKREFREDYLKQQQTINEWERKANINYSLNGHLTTEFFDELSRNNQWSAERDEYFNSWFNVIKKSVLLNKFVEMFRTFDSVDDVYENLLVPSMNEPALITQHCWEQWKYVISCKK